MQTPTLTTKRDLIRDTIVDCIRFAQTAANPTEADHWLDMADAWRVRLATILEMEA